MHTPPQLPKETVDQLIAMIKADNRAGGMYAGLAQYTYGYDTAIDRVIYLLESLPTTRGEGDV